MQRALWMVRNSASRLKQMGKEKKEESLAKLVPGSMFSRFLFLGASSEWKEVFPDKSKLCLGTTCALITMSTEPFQIVSSKTLVLHSQDCEAVIMHHSLQCFYSDLTEKNKPNNQHVTVLWLFTEPDWFCLISSTLRPVWVFPLTSNKL